MNTYRTPVVTRNTHSNVMGYLLWIFGFTGAHRFYYGKPVTGTIWFFTFGLLGIGWLIDLFLIPAMDREATLRIFGMRREVVRFQRVLGVMTDVTARLANVTMPHIDTNMRPYFRDVYDHVRRAEYRLAGLREILTSVVETSNVLEMQRQGETTRKLAAWAAILAVPTALAGIYGMNFHHMPELTWRYGYYGALGLMGTVCTILYLRFRRSGWL